jgi:hypothetical protein
MKKNYKKVMSYRAKHDGDFHYEWTGHGYHRPIRTFNEVRQNEGDRSDFRRERIPCAVRARRNDHTLNAWNDFNRSRNYGKSWKHFTRHRKQWMIGNDPAPEPYVPLIGGWVWRIAQEFGVDA